MTYETYRIIFIAGAVLAGIMLVVSVLLFVLLKIPSVIGNLTGISARRAIETIRSQNAQSADQPDGARASGRGRFTGRMSPSDRMTFHSRSDSAMETVKISTQRLASEAAPAETTVLEPSEGTEGETTVLEPVASFVILYKITFIHTDEQIE